MKNESKSIVFLIILINSLYIILADKSINNNRNLIFKNNIKIKLTNNIDDSKIIKECIFSFYKHIPNSVYLNDRQIFSYDNECLNIADYDLEEEYEIKIEWGLKIDTLEMFFMGKQNVLEVDLSEFDASEVTSMNSMFFDCKNLRNIIFGNINTSSLIDMHSTFSGCESLYSIDLSNFDTSKVIYMGYMFSECYSLISLDLTYFNTSNVRSMYNMFQECHSLISLDITNFDTSKVKIWSIYFID